MGLFDSIGKGLGGFFGPGFADRAAYGAAIGNEDYAGAASLRAGQERRKQDEAKARQEDQLMVTAYHAAKGLGLSDDEALTMASDPAKAADLISAWRTPHDYGPEGGSRLNPTTGTYSSAPRWGPDGQLFGPNADASQAPPQLLRGIKAFPVPQGGNVWGMDPQSGAIISGGPQGGAPTGRAPVPVRSPQELDALPPGAKYIGPDGNVRTKPGGPTPQASGGFLSR